jgi:outer membrane protein assembly factor BamB
MSAQRKLFGCPSENDIVRIGMIVILAALTSAAARAGDWPAWRGPRLDGTPTEKGPFPLQWSDTENVLWKTEIPGKGHSSPIVWGNRIFLTSCIEATGERLLICVNRSDGTVIWKKSVLTGPLEKKHDLNSYASSTPVTDGKHFWVTFLDEPHIRVACYDMNGERRWMVTPGKFNSPHGFCSSPILYEDLVIVNCDQDKQEAFLVGLDKTTGKERWRTDRPNRTRSYCVPLIIDVAGKKQMVLSGSLCVASYNPVNGKQNWIIQGPTEQYVASLVYDQNILFLTAGFPEHHIMGIKPDGTGDVTESAILWRTSQGASYVPSPVAQNGLFFVVSDGGLASCFEPKTGERHWMERLGKHHTASLIGADGYVYFLSDDGTTFVLKANAKFEIVHKNALKEDFYASPALSDGQIFIRGVKHLYCIGTKK